jgi:hypothetical protein
VHDRPEIVCICGSTRFTEEMRAANRELTFAGVIVVAPGEPDEMVTDEQKTALDALHLRKIDLADRVLVVNPGGVRRRVHAQGDRLRRCHRHAGLLHRSRLISTHRLRSRRDSGADSSNLSRAGAPTRCGACCPRP